LFQSRYKNQYITLRQVLFGLQGKIKRGELRKLLLKNKIILLDLPDSPQATDAIFEIGSLQVFWGDILESRIEIQTEALTSRVIKRRIFSLIKGRKFRWIVTKVSNLRLDTQILELSRQGVPTHDITQITATTWDSI
jgi:hypothetical protein